MAGLPIQLSPEDRAAVVEARRRKRRPPPPPQPKQVLPRQLAPEDTQAALYSMQQRLGVPHEIRFTPTGETTTEWMSRRWSGLLIRSGWDPTRLPIPMLHDLATAGVDDQTLLSLLDAAAPLQEELLTRIRERNDREALATSLLPARRQLVQRRIQAGPARGGYGTAGQPPDRSIVGWDDQRRRNLAQYGTQGAEFPNRATPYPEAVENLQEIAADPRRRARLDAAPWLLQFLTQQPSDPAQQQAAKQSLRNYVDYAGKGLSQPLRDAARELLQDGEDPLGVAYQLAMWQTYSLGELRERGITDPFMVLERARVNREEVPRTAAKLTGGLLGRDKLPLLAFDPGDELEAARLDATGQMAAAGLGMVHPGRILDGLNWAYDHLVSAPLGTVVQLLQPINDALIVRVPDIGGDSPGELTTGPGRPAVEWHPEAFERMVTPAEAWRRAQRGGLGGAVAQLGGLQPGDKDYEAAAAVFDLVASFYLDPIIAAGRVGAGVKAARAVPAADELSSSSLLRRATKLYATGRIPEIPHSKLGRLVYQAFSRSPEELVATGRARRTFETMAREADPVVIADRYHLPPAMADAIAGERDPNRIRDLVVAGMRGAIPFYERYELEAKVLKNQAEIARLEGLGGAQPRLYPVDRPPTNPHQPRINALRRATADLVADLQRGERIALEIRGMPTDTLAGSYRQAVKRFAGNPTRRSFTEDNQTSLMDALWRSGRTAEQRRLGRLDEPTRIELDRQQKIGRRWQQELKELYDRRAAGDQSLEDVIGQSEKALDRLAATTAKTMSDQGLENQHRLWQAREQFRARGRFGDVDPGNHPAIRALSWAYNRNAQFRSPFELLPQTGDVISVADKAQGLRVMERLGQVLDVDRRNLDHALRDYLRATGPQDTYAAVVRLLRRARALHPEYTNEILRLYRNTVESLFWVGDHDGQDMWAAVKRFMDDDMPFSQPHLSSERLSEIPLPDWRAARDLRKLSTRAQLKLKTATRPGDPLADGAVGRAAARFGVTPTRLQTAFRPLEAVDQAVSTVVAEGWAKLIRAQDVLLHRVWTPSVLLRGGWTLRVVGEEQLRMAAAGLASGVFSPGEWLRAMRGKGDFARFADRPEDLLVSYTRDLWQKTPTNVRVRKGDRAYTSSWRKELKQLADAPELRIWLNYVANEGEGAGATEKVLKWLQGHPDGQELAKQMRPIVDEVLGHVPENERMKAWVDTFRQRVHDKTRGNQALVALARDGEIRMPIEEFANLKFGGEVPQRIKIALEEYQQLLAGGQPIPHELLVELEHELGVGLIHGAGGVLKAHVPLSEDLVVEKFLDSLPDSAKPNWVKGRGFNWADEKRPVSWVNAMMEFLGGRPTNTFSRLPAYRQFAAHEYQRLRGMGISEGRAQARAQSYGIEQARQLLYELGEKSALADQMQVFSRFFNAWQEVATRWFVDLPARQGVFGHPALLRRFDIMLDAAKESGLLYENDRGEWVTKIPGFDSLVSKVMGIPMRTEFNARGFNMLTQLPGLNPWTLKALIELPTIREQWDKPGPIKATLDFIAPYGPEVNLGPAWWGRAWWGLSKGHPIAGIGNGAPPWELFSSRYQRNLWDGTLIDAMRVIDAKAKKDTGTGILATLATMPEGPEKDAAFADFIADAESMGRHFFLLRAAGGALLPAQPSFYWPNNEEAQGFYTQLNAIPEGSPARRAMYDKFIEDHPDLTSYLVGKSTAKPGTPRPVEGDDEFSLRAYWSQVESGARKRLGAEEWARYAAGAIDYQQINHDYRTESAAAGGTAAERLRNYGKVLDASARRAARIERLRQINPLWSAQFDIQIEGSRVADGAQHTTFEQHVAAQFANQVKVISDLVNDTPLEDQIDLGELRSARRALLDAFGTDYAGVADQDSVEGEIARYFRDTMDPYFDQLDGLYEQANARPRAERGPFYNQVRKLRNGWETPEGMPSPEEVLFGMADTEQQQDLRMKWASQPPGWLSDFQRETAGLPTSRVIREVWDAINESDQVVAKYIRDQHWIPQQREAIAVRDAFQAWKVQVAQANGLQEEIAREDLSPFERAATAGQLDERHWQPVAQGVVSLRQVLAAMPVDTEGTPSSIDSKAGRPYFDAFVAWLDRVRAANPDLDSAFTRWGKILGDDDEPLIGVDLYRVFLFGEFR